jgi:hypothetical protein
MDSNGPPSTEVTRDYHKNRVKYGEWEIATRAQIVGLKAFGIKNDEIAKKLGLELSTVYRIWNRAKERGFDPDHPIVRDHHVKTEHRSGRPRKPREGRDRCRCKKILCQRCLEDRAAKQAARIQTDQQLPEITAAPSAGDNNGPTMNVDNHLPIQNEMDLSPSEILPAVSYNDHLESTAMYPIPNPEAMVQPYPTTNDDVVGRNHLYNHALANT